MKWPCSQYTLTRQGKKKGENGGLSGWYFRSHDFKERISDSCSGLSSMTLAHVPRRVECMVRCYQAFQRPLSIVLHTISRMRTWPYPVLYFACDLATPTLAERLRTHRYSHLRIQPEFVRYIQRASRQSDPRSHRSIESRRCPDPACRFGRHHSLQ